MRRRGGFALPTGKTLTGAGTLIIDAMGSPGTPITVMLAGTVTVGNLYNRGTLLLGTTRVTLTGTFQQFASGTLGVSLASATNVGSITSTGSATLDGTLAITTAGGYQPAVGATFAVQSWGSVTNRYASITKPAGTWAPTYVARRLTIAKCGG